MQEFPSAGDSVVPRSNENLATMTTLDEASTGPRRRSRTKGVPVCTEKSPLCDPLKLMVRKKNKEEAEEEAVM